VRDHYAVHSRSNPKKERSLDIVVVLPPLSRFGGKTTGLAAAPREDVLRGAVR
jgi:hypothetical protein